MNDGDDDNWTIDDRICKLERLMEVFKLSIKHLSAQTQEDIERIRRLESLIITRGIDGLRKIVNKSKIIRQRLMQNAINEMTDEEIEPPYFKTVALTMNEDGTINGFDELLKYLPDAVEADFIDHFYWRLELMSRSA